MKRHIIGAAIACALGVGGAAIAHRDNYDPATGGSGTSGTGSPTQPGSTTGSSTGSATGTGTSGSTTGSTTSTYGSQSGAAAGQQEMTGRVVKADNKNLYIAHMGAVVLLAIDNNTQFADANVKTGKDIQPGQEVRASFKIKEQTRNVATRIQLSTTAGGSGSSPSGSNPSGMSGSGSPSGSGSTGSGTVPPGGGGSGSEDMSDRNGSLDSMNQGGSMPYESGTGGSGTSDTSSSPGSDTSSGSSDRLE